MKNALNGNAVFAAVLVCVVILIILATILAASIHDNQTQDVEISTLRPVDAPMRIFVDECLSEGYPFVQCYYTYDDFLNGGEVLQMPWRVA